jgi:hypothetical protein
MAEECSTIGEGAILTRASADIYRVLNLLYVISMVLTCCVTITVDNQIKLTAQGTGTERTKGPGDIY